MKTLRKEAIDLVYKEAMPEKNDMEQGKLYVVEKYNASSHLCLCGCGVECYLPLSPAQWQLTVEDGKPTIMPSILQRFDCRSHYIITKGIANFV